MKSKTKNQKFLAYLYQYSHMNKRAWIKIVEAFIAILLVAGVLLVVINRGYVGRDDISEQVYEVQTSILREIELDSGLRAEILDASETLDGGWKVPEAVNETIENRLPDYLTCTSKICELDVICEADDVPLDKNIYAQPVAIATETEAENPEFRQLKLFCWTD